jgi:hypothetical protein
MNDYAKTAQRCVNEYVERYDGNWKEVRRELLREIDLLFQHGSTGAKIFAYALDQAYHDLKPDGAE